MGRVGVSGTNGIPLDKLLNTPTDTTAPDGMPGSELENRYPGDCIVGANPTLILY